MQLQGKDLETGVIIMCPGQESVCSSPHFGWRHRLGGGKHLQ
jgi:hypothetical protein